jgi:hypothetical protein
VSDQTTLAPCPFCGGEAQISTCMDEDIWSHNAVPYTTVACGDCGIGTDSTCEGWEPTAQEAWNRRDGANPDVSNYIASLVAERDELAASRRALAEALQPLLDNIDKLDWDSYVLQGREGFDVNEAIDAARKALSAKEST